MVTDWGRKVAIKRIGTTTRSAKAVARFVREVQTVGQLEHPNVVPIHDVGQDEDGGYYFIMKYVEGKTLEAVIEDLRAGDPRAHAQFGIEQRVRIFRELAEAIAFAHSKGVIHRDLKPANVMVGPYGEVSVLDWGIAVSSEATWKPGDTLDREGVLIGTQRYMAPEQARRLEADRRTDVYALCVILHELLTLRHYLDDVERVQDVLDGVLHRPVPLASTVHHPHQDAVPMDLSWIIDQGARKDPTERYETVDALIERLADRSEGRVHVQCPVTFTKRASSEVERAMDRWVVPRMGGLLAAGPAGIAAAADLMVAALGAMAASVVAVIVRATLAIAGSVT
jgi:serine/threonine protein kinase